MDGNKTMRGPQNRYEVDFLHLLSSKETVHQDVVAILAENPVILLQSVTDSLASVPKTTWAHVAWFCPQRSSFCTVFLITNIKYVVSTVG